MLIIILTLYFVCVGAPWLKNTHKQPGADWWYGMGDTWDTSSHLASTSPYYKMYRQSSAQMDWYGFAQHVGKINRGQFLNPEQNMPRHRAIGPQADFNPEDLRSGAFKYKPRGQRFRAAAVHVNLGLANHVGEVRTMPLGQHVQADGSVLVQTSPRQRSPCQPDPCKHFSFFTCSVVNDVTAKCSDSENEVQLVLTGYQLLDVDYPNWNALSVFPDYHDGSACRDAAPPGQPPWEYIPVCGVVNYSADYLDYYDDDSDQSPSKDIITLGTSSDGTNYRDFTYGLIAGFPFVDASMSRVKLTVTVDGRDRQVLAVPQWDGTTNVNPDGRFLYFFGCFRPQTGLVDTRGAGFYMEDSAFFADFADGGLCKALQDWTGWPGFNPYEPAGGA